MEEVKPSFTFKYFFLVGITIVLTALLTIAVDYFKEKQQEKVIKISLLDGDNQISKTVDSDIIDVKFRLKRDSSIINSFFQKSIIITNIGKSGVENIKIKISPNDSNIILLKNPWIETKPKRLAKFIELKYNYISDKTHVISVPLINKNESLILKYSAYSTNYIDYLDLDVNIRKKDLNIVISENLLPEEENIGTKILSLATLSLFVVFIFTVILYYLRFRANPDIRKIYNNNFWFYYLKN